MKVNSKQLNIILDHLFGEKDDQKECVRIVVTEGVSYAQAERRSGVRINTGYRFIEKYEAHIKYLKSLGLK